MGLDGFALNIGDATQPYVSEALSYLFSYAESVGFKMFVSMDLSASGAACSSSGTSVSLPATRVERNDLLNTPCCLPARSETLQTNWTIVQRPL
jgi:hypothetical protein